jgi:hypothetical protein
LNGIEKIVIGYHNEDRIVDQEDRRHLDRIHDRVVEEDNEEVELHRDKEVEFVIPQVVDTQGSLGWYKQEQQEEFEAQARKKLF